MTVVAAYRGEKDSLNTLLVDTVCLAPDKPTEPAFRADKIGHVYGNTYITGRRR